MLLATSGPNPFKRRLDEIGVAKPLAVIENGDDFWRNPEQFYFLHLSWRVRRDLRKFLEHQLGHLVDLLRVGDALSPAADRQTANFVPVGVRQIDRERDLTVAREVFGFLGSAAQPKKISRPSLT